MRANAIFLTGLLTMIIFNVFYVVMQPEAIWTLTVGAMAGFISTIVAVGVISGIQILGTGLSGTSVRLIFGISALLNTMFQITIAGMPVGLGLANNVMNTFTGMGSFPEMVGFLLGTGLSVLTMVSGLMVISGSGSD